MILLQLLLSNLVLCFYKQGHTLIGKIVDNTLNNVTKSIINIRIADISPWADSIKRKPGYGWTRSLHYIDTPTDPEKGDCEVTELDTENPNLFVALLNYSTRISDKNTRTYEDLKFFVHLYEDLFQPLHMSGIYRGGNNYPVNFFGKNSSLHEVWDYLILKRNINEKGKLNKYTNYITEMTKKKQPFKPFDFDFWIKHNNRINCACVYKNLTYNVSDIYYTKNKEILDQLVIMASVNLKYILENLYN